MNTITPREALQGREYAIVKVRDKSVYDLYGEANTAMRIVNDLNKRYGDKYEVCAIDFGGMG